MRTFRILSWLGIGVFWGAILLVKFLIVGAILQALLFTVGILIMIQGLTVFMYLIKESDESLESQDMNQHNLYKALERLDDIEDSNC